MSTTSTRATLADLMSTQGKAELIGGKIVPFLATGIRPSRIASRIFQSLSDHTQATGRGLAFNDNLGYAVPELGSGRESFSPDASYYLGPLPADDMDFVSGPPTFAVEVRSKNDHGPAAELEMAAKRADYFEAGTLAVWDVALKAGVIRHYRADDPTRPTTFSPGQVANAEPAVPGWRVEVHQILA